MNELSFTTTCCTCSVFLVGITMNNAEIEFLAERELIPIVPRFNCAKLYLISGEVGPCHVGIPIEVPLWLAMNLKQRNECQIQTPIWMNLTTLESIKDEETNSELFTKLPSEHFQEISQILLNQAPGDIPNADNIRTMIKDILDIRVAKLRSSIDKFVKLKATYARLDNLTQMEINAIRNFLTSALDHMRNLNKTEKFAERLTSVLSDTISQ